MTLVHHSCLLSLSTLSVQPFLKEIQLLPIDDNIYIYIDNIPFLLQTVDLLIIFLSFV